MIPYHSYDSPALVHPHHPAYTANNNPVEQELPKYTRWEILLFEIWINLHLLHKFWKCQIDWKLLRKYPNKKPLFVDRSFVKNDRSFNISEISISIFYLSNPTQFIELQSINFLGQVLVPNCAKTVSWGNNFLEKVISTCVVGTNKEILISAPGEALPKFLKVILI